MGVAQNVRVYRVRSQTVESVVLQVRDETVARRDLEQEQAVREDIRPVGQRGRVRGIRLGSDVRDRSLEMTMAREAS